CTQGPLSSSPKLDAALQQVVQSGSQARVPIIVTANSGLLGGVDNLLVGLSSTLLVDLPSINGVVATIAPADLATVTCSTAVVASPPPHCLARGGRRWRRSLGSLFLASLAAATPSQPAGRCGGGRRCLGLRHPARA